MEQLPEQLQRFFEAVSPVTDERQRQRRLVAGAMAMAAKLFLEAGQPLEARWAARQGLAAGPLCERLWIRLMDAADDVGESQEIERLMDELDTALESWRRLLRFAPEHARRLGPLSPGKQPPPRFATLARFVRSAPLLARVHQ